MTRRILPNWVLPLGLAMLFLPAGGCTLGRDLRAREEARSWVAQALRLHEAGGEEELLRRARAADASYDVDSCERGMRLERDGDLPSAAVSYQACLQADPEQAYAYLRYGESLRRARGTEAADEIVASLRTFMDLTVRDPAAAGDRRKAADLIKDVDLLLQAQKPRVFPERYSAEEIVAILLRAPRGTSPYDGPRVPLRLGFRPGDTSLGAAAREQLRQVARALKDGRMAGSAIQLEGHTDDVEGGTRDARLALSRQRAEAAKGFLVSNGIPARRLTIKGYADDYPLDPSRSHAGREANRRVELVNLKTGESVMRDRREQP